MKKLVCSYLLIYSGIIVAAERSITLSIPGMDCPVCPVTIKKSLQKVAGVSAANVSYESKTALVTFDDQVTDVKSVLKATGNVGYPSIIKEDKK